VDCYAPAGGLPARETFLSDVFTFTSAPLSTSVPSET
jgi:hypothetical protein